MCTKIDVSGMTLWDGVQHLADASELTVGFGPSGMVHVLPWMQAMKEIDNIHDIANLRMAPQSPMAELLRRVIEAETATNAEREALKYRGESVEVVPEWCEFCQDYHAVWNCSVCQSENFCGYWDEKLDTQLGVCVICKAEVPLVRRKEPEDINAP